jgi:hypothetical protein
LLSLRQPLFDFVRLALHVVAAALPVSFDRPYDAVSLQHLLEIS